MHFNVFSFCQYAQQRKLNHMKYNVNIFQQENFQIYSSPISLMT